MAIKERRIKCAVCGEREGLPRAAKKHTTPGTVSRWRFCAQKWEEWEVTMLRHARHFSLPCKARRLPPSAPPHILFHPPHILIQAVAPSCRESLAIWRSVWRRSR